MGFQVLIRNFMLSLVVLSWTVGPALAAGELGGGVPDSGPVPGRHGGTGLTSGPSQGASAAAPSASQTSGLNAPAAQFEPWSNEAQYQSCGQSCLLKRANETLTMQAVYIEKRLNDVEGLYAQEAQTTSTSRFDPMMAEIHSFCPEVPMIDTSNDDAETCLRKYIETQLPVLRSIRTAVAQNTNNEAALNPKIASIDANGNVQERSITSAFAVQSAVPPRALLPQTPYAVSPKDLQTARIALQQQNQAQNYFASETYNEWIQDPNTRPKRPNKSDFIIWQSVPIDPNDPSLGFTTKATMGADGNAKYDDKAFAAALAQYKQEMRRFETLAKGKHGNDVSPINQAATASAEKDYQSAYSDFVQQSNSSFLSQGVGVMTVGARTPAMASGPVAPAQVAPTMDQTQETLTIEPEYVDGVISVQTDWLKKLGSKIYKNF